LHVILFCFIRFSITPGSRESLFQAHKGTSESTAVPAELPGIKQLYPFNPGNVIKNGEQRLYIFPSYIVFKVATYNRVLLAARGWK